MIKHVVMWRLKDEAENRDKAANAALLKEKLEALRYAGIPGLLSLQVGLDYVGSDTSADVVLISEHVDKAALQAYQEHPEHQAVIPLVRAIACERRAVDFDG